MPIIVSREDESQTPSYIHGSCGGCNVLVVAFFGSVIFEKKKWLKEKETM